MKKSVLEIQKLHDAIIEQLVNLSENDAFGESNDSSRKECETHLADLKQVLEGGKAETDAVQSWIYGNDDDFLSDYIN